MSKSHNAKRVLVSFPVQLLEDIDAVAEAEERTRSELIREALRKYMRTFGRPAE